MSLRIKQIKTDRNREGKRVETQQKTVQRLLKINFVCYLCDFVYNTFVQDGQTVNEDYHLV